MNSIFHKLFMDNPMMEEGMRFRRRFLRGEGDIAKVLVVFIAIAYLMVAWAIWHTHEDACELICYVQLIGLTIVLPLSIYGAVSGERERATWEALVLTRLTPAQIIAGKIAWRVLLMVFITGLLVLLEIVSGLSAQFSTNSSPRTTLADAANAELLILTWGLLITAFGFYVSSNTVRSVTSAAVIISVILGILAFIPLLGTVFDTLGPHDNYLWLWFNPFYGLNQIFSANQNYGRSPGDPSAYATFYIWVSIVYLVGAALFIYITYRSLKNLETPQRKSAKSHAVSQ